MTIIHMDECQYVIEIYIKEGFRVREYESINGSSFAEVLGKLPIAVKVMEEKEARLAAAKLADDDIPF